MVIQIYEGYDKSYVLVGCRQGGENGDAFHRNWGNVVRLSANNLYKELEEIASWVNNELGEECLFELS